MGYKGLISDISCNAHPFLIAGPCSVESYSMMEIIIRQLQRKGITVFRAGTFKPRTSPYDFQGLGMEGLFILNSLREKYKVKIVTEVIDVRHIELMSNMVDILQVGTRNMFNYELLKELGNVNIPILLKRGMCATINEYINAAQYILQSGNDKIILCERGIRSFDSSTRNLLDLSSVAIIKEETNFPIIVDLSHSLGRKDIILPMARASFAAGADGLMLEVHNNPNNALSDASQQLNLEEFELFIEKLKRSID